MDKIDTKLIQVAILLDRQHLLIERLIKNSNFVLHEFEKAEKTTLDHVLDVYNYVFALIDHLVRYQKIASTLPRFSKKSAEYRSFNTSMGELKDIRNQFQHINNDVENNYTGPLLGAVCWISSNTEFLASLNDVGRSRSFPSMSFDTQTGTYSHEFCYTYNDKYHDLGGAIKGARTFNQFVKSKVRIEIDGKPYNSKNHFMALRMSMVEAPETET